MQDGYDINKEVINELSEKLENLIGEDRLASFEYYEKELQKVINQLKAACKIKNYEHAKNIIKGIECLIEKAEKSTRLVGTASSSELEKLTEYKENVKEILLELDEKETHNFHHITKSFKDSTETKLKEKPYHERFSDYNKFGALIYNLTKKLEGIREDLYERSKLLRKNHYQKKMLEKEPIEEFGKILLKAKESCTGLEDIENSFNLFRKDVLEH